jgi:hypothetical protein
MQEAMLLGEVGAEGPFDDNLPRLDRDEAGADGPHEGLPVEARPNPRGEFRVCAVARQLSPRRSSITLFATVAFALANRQAVRLVAEPLHARFCAIRRPNGLLHSISFELDLTVDGDSLEAPWAIQVLDGDFILPLSTCKSKKRSFGAVPLAEPLVGCRLGAGRARLRFSVAATGKEERQQENSD